MKSVLFVDDDPNVLAGLRRMLRPLRTEWTTEFVDCGEKALAYMAANPVTRGDRLAAQNFLWPCTFML